VLELYSLNEPVVHLALLWTTAAAAGLVLAVMVKPALLVLGHYGNTLLCTVRCSIHQLLETLPNSVCQYPLATP